MHEFITRTFSRAWRSGETCLRSKEEMCGNGFLHLHFISFPWTYSHSHFYSHTHAVDRNVTNLLAGSFPFPSCFIPISIPIPTFYLILVPFPWDYHGTPIPIGIPNPMPISMASSHRLPVRARRLWASGSHHCVPVTKQYNSLPVNRS